MRKFSVLLVALLFVGVGAAFGQGRTISGKVVDSESGDPIIGASVEVVDAQTGSSTDENGKFTVTLPDGYTKLKVEQTSYTTQVVTAREGMVIRLVLSGELLQEAEVEVAVGTKKGKGYVGSAQTVSQDVVEKKSPTDITKALSGEVAGMRVVTSTGQPGVTSTVKLRGTHSFNADGGALYVVDGVPYNGDIAAIDPSDIVSTTVLKDATATSMYGSQGANGVILITTKKGTAGSEGKIEVDVKYGLNARILPMHDVITDPKQYMELVWIGLHNYAKYGLGSMTPGADANKMLWSKSGELKPVGIPEQYNLFTSADVIDPKTGKFRSDVGLRYTPESWKENMFHVGKKYETTVKLSGGSDKTTYYTSIGFLSDEGYYIQSDYKRLSALSNLDYSPKKWLTANFKAQYTFSSQNAVGQSSRAANNGFRFVNNIPPIYPVFQHNPDGSIAKDPYNGGKAYDYGQYIGYSRPYSAGINPAGALQLDKNYNESHQLALLNALKFEFVKDLKINITNSYGFYTGKTSNIMNMFYGDGAGFGRISQYMQSVMDFNSIQQAMYNKTFADVHNTDYMVAHTFRYQRGSSMRGGKGNLFRPTDLEFSNATQLSYLESSSANYTSESYIGEFRYNYNEKYFAILNGSIYGSSNFAPGHQYGAYASAGASWNIHRELFMADAKRWLSNLKLKASFGTTGNDQVGPNLYRNMYGVTSYVGNPAVVATRVGVPSITWEKVYRFNSGIEFDIKKGRLYGEIEVYHDLVVDNIDTRVVAPSVGYGAIPVNEGKFRNYGFEALLKSKVVKSRNFDLNLRLTLSHNNNRIVELPKEYMYGQWVEMTINGGAMKGFSMGDIFASKYVGVNPKNGRGQWIRYRDANVTDKNAEGYYYISNVHLYKNEKTVKDGKVVLKHPNANIVADTVHFAPIAGVDYTGKNVYPDLVGGFGLDFSTYGFDVSMSFNYIIGGYNYDAMYIGLMGDPLAGSTNYHKDMLNCWNPLAGNTNTDIPGLFAGQGRFTDNAKDYDTFYKVFYKSSYANAASDRFLISNTALQFDNVRIAYNFPKKMLDKMKLKSLNLWVMANNLMVISHRKGYNPFIYMNGGNSSADYVPSSTIMGGVKFSF